MMKKKLIIYLVFMLVFVSFTNAASYKITGKVVGGNEGMIYLAQLKGGKFINVDSTNMANGAFTFVGSVQEPDMFYLKFKDNEKVRFGFILENSNLNVEADLTNSTKRIYGSPAQDVLNNYNELMKPFNMENGELSKSLKEANKVKDKNEIEKISLQISKNEEIMSNKMIDFVKKNNKSFASSYIVGMQRLNDADKIDELVNILDKSLRNNRFVVGMIEKSDILKKSAIGQIAPDFTMDDVDGKPITLSSLIGKGYLLVDFWASWCGPCRAENPNLVKDYVKYHDKGFDVFGISYDVKKDAWIEAIKKDNLPWLHASDLKGWGNAGGKLYDINVIPSNVLLNKEGRIIAKNLRGDALTEKLAELFD